MRTWAIVSGVLFTVGALAICGWSRSGAAEAAKDAPVLHVVLFQFKPDASAGDASALIADSHRLLKQIPVVEDLHVGRKALDQREVHIKDYDVALYIKFKKAADVQIYSDHPKHVEFANKYRPKTASIRVADFYSE